MKKEDKEYGSSSEDGIYLRENTIHTVINLDVLLIGDGCFDVIQETIRLIINVFNCKFK